MPFLEIFFAAYKDLQYDRPVGFVAGSIPWSSIIRWCHLHGICDIDEIETFISHIRAMEKAEFEFDEKKNGAST